MVDPQSCRLPRARLRALGLRPRKRLSQSFLDDERIAAAIVDAADVADQDVLEVGPGLGILTERLARRARRVVAVEIDAELAKALPALENVQILNQDILKFDATSAFHAPFVVVANLPYHITSPALRHLLRTPTKRLLVMVQAEVATRIGADSGDLSALAVMVQVQATVEQVLRVPRTAFFPRPKVDSAVLRVVPRPTPLIPREEMDAFTEVVHAGFKQPRKTLLNSLTDGLGGHRAQAAALIDKARLEPGRRPQELQLEDWVTLYTVST